jgi:hypothetical protein
VKSRHHLFLAAVALGVSVFALSTAAAMAQQATPTPAPAKVRHTVVSSEYDGATHLTFTPYVWLPTANGTFQFDVPNHPKVGGGFGGNSTLNAQVGPNSYLNNINFALMGAVELRKGDVGVYGDVITLNVSSGDTFITDVSGPFGHVHVPVDIGTSGRISATVWEAGGDLTIAHSDSADLQFLTGWRQIRVTGNFDYNVDIGKDQLFSRSGSASTHTNIGDVVFGFKGKVALGDGGWFVPYYVDYGVGAPSNNTWQAYTGVGKATRGGSFLLLFRDLNYDFGPGATVISKLRMGGPLVGYTFSL